MYFALSFFSNPNSTLFSRTKFVFKQPFLGQAEGGTIKKRKEILLLGVLSLTGFVTSFGAYIVAANLPSYSRETGAGLMVIGVLIALYDVAEIIFKPLAGLLSKKWGEWRVLRMGLVLFSLVSGLYLIFTPEWLVLVRLLQGAGAAFFSVMSMTLLIRYFMDRKGMALGIYGACKNSGYVLAPTMGGVFVYYHSFRSVFALCLAVGLLAIVLTYLIRPQALVMNKLPTYRKNRKHPAVKDLFDSVRNGRMLPIFLIMFFSMIFMSAFFGFMPVLLSSKGLDPIQAGIILAVNATLYLGVQPFAGRFSDTLGRKKVMGLGMFISTVSVSLLPFFGHPYYIGFACLMAIGIGSVAPLGEAFVGDVSDVETLALNLGVAGSYKELGEMLGPISMGFVGQTFGLHWAFLLVGFAGLGGLCCLMFLREKANAFPCKQEPSPIESSQVS